MKLPLSHTFRFLCLFFTISSSHAMPSDEQVANWASQILLQTITVNYQGLEAHEKSRTVRKYYSGQAWSGFGNFFSNVIPLIIRNKLQTKPSPVGDPTIIGKGLFNGVPYWKVEQTFYFPRIDKYVWFSVIVIQNDEPPLIIESLNMDMPAKP